MYFGKQSEPPGSAYLTSDAEPEDDPSTALVAYAGDVASEHVLILGHRAPAIMYALIRSGCVSVTELRQSDRPEAQTADLAIVPNIGALDDAALVIRHAKRALMAAGRIVLCIAAEPPGQLVRKIAALLQQQGFSAISWRRDGNRTLMSATLPGSGLLPHA
jgi:hypothetical protein